MSDRRTVLPQDFKLPGESFDSADQFAGEMDSGAKSDPDALIKLATGPQSSSLLAPPLVTSPPSSLLEDFSLRHPLLHLSFAPPAMSLRAGALQRSLFFCSHLAGSLFLWTLYCCLVERELLPLTEAHVDPNARLYAPYSHGPAFTAATILLGDFPHAFLRYFILSGQAIYDLDMRLRGLSGRRCG